MRITISKEAREVAQEQAVQDIIELAKQAVSKNNSSFVFDYSKYGNNFYMHQVSSAIEKLTEGTVTGGNKCHNTSAKTYKFYIKVE